MNVEYSIYECVSTWFRDLDMRQSRLLDALTRSCAVLNKSCNDGLNIACSL